MAIRKLENMTSIVWNINSCICASGIGMTIPTLWDGYRRYRQSWISPTLVLS